MKSDIIAFPASRVVAGPRPVEADPKTRVAPAISREAFIRWLPPKLRPAVLAVELLDIAKRHGRDAARPTWASRQAGLAAMMAERGIRGRRAFDLAQAWEREVRAACSAEKARRAKRLADFAEFTQTDEFWSGAS